MHLVSVAYTLGRRYARELTGPYLANFLRSLSRTAQIHRFPPQLTLLVMLADFELFISQFFLPPGAENNGKPTPVRRRVILVFPHLFFWRRLQIPTFLEESFMRLASGMNFRNVSSLMHHQSRLQSSDIDRYFPINLGGVTFIAIDALILCIDGAHLHLPL